MQRGWCDGGRAVIALIALSLLNWQSQRCYAAADAAAQQPHCRCRTSLGVIN
jgi:hypothetical protein